MAAEAATVLIKKGKKSTVSYIHDVCKSRNINDITTEVFNTILNPTVPIDDWDTLDWCKLIIAGGLTSEEFAKQVRKYDNATTCGLVWTANFVAYRCRTCGISPCMSLCSECFQKGNHEGHDFNMFRSQAGGACDCGDKSVMRESGFCQRHGSQNQLNKPEAPFDLLCVAEAFIPYLFLRLIHHLRDNCEPRATDRYQSAILMADGFLTMLHKHSEMGAAMRDIMTKVLTDPALYIQIGVVENHFFNDEHKKNCSLLEELVFWTIQYEFPQKLVFLLLNMMPNVKYKEAFTRTFVKHYGEISKMLAEAIDTDTLSNRVVHVSVQIFSNEDLAYEMTKNNDLLRIMVNCLNSMMSKVLISQNYKYIKPGEYNRLGHSVVDCSHRIMKDHCYWPLVSDLNNVLTHEAVAFEFLSDHDLLLRWFCFLTKFQSMNLNQRELKTHVEFESNTYYAAFSAELEASATPMWALISHLKSPDTLEKTKLLLEVCLETILEWFDSISFTKPSSINPFQVSFHLPLHRCFVSFLGQAVRHQGGSLDDLLPDENVLKLLIMHPLQAQVAFHEILCNMWVRSGLQIKGQAMTYIQCHFCNSIVDADLFLLQLCAMKLDPDWFLKTVMERFHVWSWFSFDPDTRNNFLESDKVLPMLEGALSFLCTLLSIHTNIGQTEEEVTRQEMISLLCMSDRTHSQLMDLLPDKCGAISQNKDFESILNKLADYKAPIFEAGGAMLQGMYVPKPEVWEQEYDPIHVLLRAVHRREYQSSLDRYTQFLRQSNKYTSSHPPWPPYRIPGPVHKEFIDPRRILHCKTMHGIIFTILYRAVNDPDIPEQVLSLCIYLLDMAVRFPSTSQKVETVNRKEWTEVEDVIYKDWFNSTDILENVTQVVEKIVLYEPHPVVFSPHMVDQMATDLVLGTEMVEEMDVDEVSETIESAEMEVGVDAYDVQSPIVEDEAANHQPELPATNTQLALPPSVSSSNDNTAVVPVTSGELVSVTPAVASASIASTSSVSTSVGNSHFYGSVDIIPAPSHLAQLIPKALRLKQIPGARGLYFTDRVSERSLNLKDQKTVSESILSLLLKLHSKLSEKSDSYQLKAELSTAMQDQRIGDGAVFVERVIDKIASSGADKIAVIQNLRQKIWPQVAECSGSPASEKMDKEERRRRAKERQQKLMAEFASKQKAFMQKTMETEKDDNPISDETLITKEKEYECVICGQMSSSAEERPVGMVVLLQATSVVGHRHQIENRKLPCNEEEQLQLQRGKTWAAAEESKIDLMTRYFDNKHWPLAISIGWEGGVYVQSCGHFLHIDCHKSYVQSLKNQNQLSSRLQNLAVDRGEYSCPLCRQLANSVIPMCSSIENSAAIVHSHQKSLKEMSSELSELIASPLSERESNLLKKYMGAIMEDIMNATYAQYRSVGAPNSSSLFSFVCSIARTNLEIELIQRGGTTVCAPLKKKSCLVPLLHVLSMNSRFLSQAVPYNVLTRLTGQMPSDHYCLSVYDVEVPLLLRDVLALFFEIILTLPLNIGKAYYSSIIQILYNFLYVQALVQVSTMLNQSQRASWKKTAIEKVGPVDQANDSEELQNNEDPRMNDLAVILGSVIENLEHGYLYIEDDEMDPEQRSTVWNEKELESNISGYCLHFLRIAALLQSHLYEESSLPFYCKDDEEFECLCQYLGLLPPESKDPTATSCLKWTVHDPRILIKTWCQDFVNFSNKSIMASRALIQRTIKFHLPQLLRLPHNYDDIFKYYHKKPCSVCNEEPKDPSLCLVCGTMVCLRESCCRQQSLFEAVMHSVACGAGTAMYIAVNSSTVIVIRGKRACLWGSVYLDSYGEEDRDLKRGKPLFLSEARYNLLQQQWINHSFDHTNKRWVWHKDNL
ncbi:E3 ubiquitin-protein ligase ubr3-like [Uloborus diversus]|uniref:E3 ubiquitin-protein ligase ubr3-like n=1 Tax=Uloborus diversus TaxID=327109 RepID=UPI00240996AD|nr:E3 ubiquitin-protein ligase ubr3-like [Uloborus diversus]